MDKVFITKNDLANSINIRKNNAGPFLTAFVLFWLFTSLIWIVPVFVFGCIAMILYIPFYFIDQAIVKRRKNGHDY